MYPGRTYTDCKICEPSIWGCSAGTDGKKRKYPADTPYDVKNQVSRHVIGKAADIGPAVVKDSRWTPEVKNDIVKYNLQLFLDPNDSTGQRSLSQSGIYPTYFARAY